MLLLNRSEHLLSVPSLPKPAESDTLFPSAPWQDQVEHRVSATALWNTLTDAFMGFGVEGGRCW